MKIAVTAATKSPGGMMETGRAKRLIEPAKRCCEEGEGKNARQSANKPRGEDERPPRQRARPWVALKSLGKHEGESDRKRQAKHVQEDDGGGGIPTLEPAPRPDEKTGCEKSGRGADDPSGKEDEPAKASQERVLRCLTVGVSGERREAPRVRCTPGLAAGKVEEAGQRRGRGGAEPRKLREAPCPRGSYGRGRGQT